MNGRAHWNGARFSRKEAGGHYESWFQRANHPQRPLAFWIRYTIFSPRGDPGAAIGELWAVVFDGENDRIESAKVEVPIDRCRYASRGLDVAIAEAELGEGGLRGQAEAIGWDLEFSGGMEPLLLLPERLYRGGFPKAKALVGTPLASYDGSLTLGAERIAVDGWVGSQNHNWGSRHTDRYAWGQVAGFDNDPLAFFECGTGRIKLGPIWSPWITMLVLRVDGEEYRVNGLDPRWRTKASYEYFRWRFQARRGPVEIRGTIHAPRQNFVALRYYNPPGGDKTCLNSKLARCTIELACDGQPTRRLETKHRAAFEILTDDRDHGLEPVR